MVRFETRDSKTLGPCAEDVSRGSKVNRETTKIGRSLNTAIYIYIYTKRRREKRAELISAIIIPGESPNFFGYITLLRFRRSNKTVFPSLPVRFLFRVSIFSPPLPPTHTHTPSTRNSPSHPSVQPGRPLVRAVPRRTPGRREYRHGRPTGLSPIRKSNLSAGARNSEPPLPSSRFGRDRPWPPDVYPLFKRNLNEDAYRGGEPCR